LCGWGAGGGPPRCLISSLPAPTERGKKEIDSDEEKKKQKRKNGNKGDTRRRKKEKLRK
jgi:hypothetical protein